MGAFKDNFLVAVIASLGVIIGAAYMLWLYKRVIFANLLNKELLKMPDLNKSEIFILWSLALPTLFFGFYPEPLINTVEVSVNNLIEMYNYNYMSNKIILIIEMHFSVHRALCKALYKSVCVSAIFTMLYSN